MATLHLLQCYPTQKVMGPDIWNTICDDAANSDSALQSRAESLTIRKELGYATSEKHYRKSILSIIRNLREEPVMSFAYHYSFSAPAKTSPEELEEFLKTVERAAQQLGFAPTIVLNMQFDTAERREFSRHLGGSCVLEDERLKGSLVLRNDQVWHHHAESGTVRLIPERGVLLVLTDEHKRETCLGFMKYPSVLWDSSNGKLLDTPFAGRWIFRDFVNSPDPRYRHLIDRFRLASYLESESDEFVG